jgi:hypothetical protein
MSVDFNEPSPTLHRETRNSKDIVRRCGSSLHKLIVKCSTNGIGKLDYGTERGR